MWTDRLWPEAAVLRSHIFVGSVGGRAHTAPRRPLAVCSERPAIVLWMRFTMNYWGSCHRMTERRALLGPKGRRSTHAEQCSALLLQTRLSHHGCHSMARVSIGRSAGPESAPPISLTWASHSDFFPRRCPMSRLSMLGAPFRWLTSWWRSLREARWIWKCTHSTCPWVVVRFKSAICVHELISRCCCRRAR